MRCSGLIGRRRSPTGTSDEDLRRVVQADSVTTTRCRELMSTRRIGGSVCASLRPGGTSVRSAWQHVLSLVIFVAANQCCVRDMLAIEVLGRVCPLLGTSILHFVTLAALLMFTMSSRHRDIECGASSRQRPITQDLFPTV
jgi:hypothetical protein